MSRKKRLVEPASQDRLLSHELVVDAHRADNSTEPALEGLLHAEQPDHIGGVAMICNLAAGAVIADLAVILAHSLIAHVPQEIAAGVLRAGRSEMQAKAPEEALAIGYRPAIHGDSTNHLEAASIGDLIAPCCDLAGERGQGKIALAQLAKRFARGPGGGQGALELIDLFTGELNAPVVASPHLFAPPGRGDQQGLEQRTFMGATEIVQGLSNERVVAHESDTGRWLKGRRWSDSWSSRCR